MSFAFEMTRRDCLRAIVSGAISTEFVSGRLQGAQGAVQPKRVAAVVTEYRKHSHADVIVGKILDGWKQQGGPGPALELASMYVDQFPGNDLARPRAREHDVPIFATIEEALTLGGEDVAVDGVLSIAEHGRYPYNEKGQHLYPRRRFFAEITDALEKHGRVVPVFNDKHLGPEWDDAHWMYERARELQIPFMAGSSLPVTFRKPELTLPVGSAIESAVGVGYSGLDVYGIHTLECFQSLVEKRRGVETGVKWVQCLQGEEMWKPVDEGAISIELLKAALRVTPLGEETSAAIEKLRELQGENVALFLIGYGDGFLGAVFMLSGLAGGISAAVRLAGEAQPRAAHFEERPVPYYPHFAYLLKAIERMMHTGEPAYPVERTYLTSGILDRLLTSRIEGHKKVETPELEIRYQPVDYPHAPRPELTSSPLGR